MKIYEVLTSKFKFLNPKELRGSYTPAQLSSLGFKQASNGSWYTLRTNWNRLVQNKQIYETEEASEVLHSVDVAKKNIHKILKAAQQQYNNWDESDIDTYAGGGICHLIAEDICSVLYDLGIECTTQSCSYEQHVYVVAKFEEGIYQVDIPYHVYETGGGFSWKKLPNIEFEPRDVVFYKITSDPSEWSNYVDLYEGASGYIPSEKEKNDPRYKTALTIDIKPDSIKQNAKRLGLGNIKRSGIPNIANTNGKI